MLASSELQERRTHGDLQALVQFSPVQSTRARPRLTAQLSRRPRVAGPSSGHVSLPRPAQAVTAWIKIQGFGIQALPINLPLSQLLTRFLLLNWENNMPEQSLGK